MFTAFNSTFNGGLIWGRSKPKNQKKSKVLWPSSSWLSSYLWHYLAIVQSLTGVSERLPVRLSQFKRCPLVISSAFIPSKDQLSRLTDTDVVLANHFLSPSLRLPCCISDQLSPPHECFQPFSFLIKKGCFSLPFSSKFSLLLLRFFAVLVGGALVLHFCCFVFFSQHHIAAPCDGAKRSVSEAVSTNRWTRWASRLRRLPWD